MDKTIRKYTSFDEMKADEYRYWQSRPVHERMDAVSEMTLAAYAMKGAAPDVPRFQSMVGCERESDSTPILRGDAERDQRRFCGRYEFEADFRQAIERRQP